MAGLNLGKQNDLLTDGDMREMSAPMAAPIDAAFDLVSDCSRTALIDIVEVQ